MSVHRFGSGQTRETQVNPNSHDLRAKIYVGRSKRLASARKLPFQNSLAHAALLKEMILRLTCIRWSNGKKRVRELWAPDVRELAVRILASTCYSVGQDNPLHVFGVITYLAKRILVNNIMELVYPVSASIGSLLFLSYFNQS